MASITGDFMQYSAPSWDGEARRIGNLSDGVDPQDAATVAQLGSSGGSGSFIQSGAGAVTRTQQDKSRDVVSVTDFGAIGDGATDDSAAFIAALAAHKFVRVPWTNSGYNLGSAQITIDDGQFLAGENYVLLKSTASTSCIRITGYNYEHGLSDFTFDMTGGSGTAVRFGTSGGIVFRSKLERLRFQNCVEAIGQETHATNYVSDISAVDIYCRNTRGRQIYIKRSRGFTRFANTIVDHVWNSVVDVSEGARFEDFAGLELDRFDLVNLARTLPTRTYKTGLFALVISGTSPIGNAAVWLKRVFADTCDGNGISISNVSYLFSDEMESVNCLGYQAYLSSIREMTFSNSMFIGGSGITGAVAATPACVLDTCEHVSGGNNTFNSATGIGLYVKDTTGLVLTATRAVNNGNYGVFEYGSSDNNTFLGVHLSGNGSTYSLVGNSSSAEFVTMGGVTYGPITLSMPSTDFTGLNSSAAQPVFPSGQDAVQLGAATTYEFEAQYVITRAAGTVSHTTGVLFGGTATVTSMDYLVQVTNPTGNALAPVQQIMGNSAGLTTVTTANTIPTENLIIRLRGSIRTNAGGTIIPQFQYSTAPGGVPTVKRNSFFRIKAAMPGSANSVGPVS